MHQMPPRARSSVLPKRTRKTGTKTKPIHEPTESTEPQPITKTTGDIKINKAMFEYLNHIRAINTQNHEIKDNIFATSDLDFVNATVRGDNFYMLDKYGLPIRKKEQNNPKPAFGWKYDENHEPINININPNLLKTNSYDIQIITLKQLKEKFPNQFKPPRGMIWKIYSNKFPDIDLNAL